VPIQALYVDPNNGPYPDLLGAANCWGIERDAKTYAGPWPVVAHPPCGPWGRMRALCKHQDPDCGPRAVEQVRAFGGVLEHPADSSLWRHCGLPRPGELDFSGLFTIEVQQCDWGHRARKRTWLLFGGVDRRALPPRPPRREPTHCVDDGGARRDGKAPRLPRMPYREVHLTPPAFARWLVQAVGG